MDRDRLIEVGEFYQELNNMAGSDLPLRKIYRSKGFPAHLLKQKHLNCLRLIDSIPDIIRSPDYVGISPNENGNAIELIKTFNKDNILLGIKLNIDKNYLYVSTMYEIQRSKLNRRLHSGKLKKFQH